ncbi:hypothetical protein GCK72_017189 [Caenorhabditis remanei]|uniref:Uncharacterized protein n=1 Tax=Caenorhabditis remanei TaxID=31234 RepID=A0A6A5G6F5_CAERE|nr:hypothetical protein GCK72_017189 [Caenorhabditis remanei]KAF1750638.1 hypothetical protein GCK72_017189 [Caenorhabditis remanei]
MTTIFTLFLLLTLSSRPANAGIAFLFMQKGGNSMASKGPLRSVSECLIVTFICFSAIGIVIALKCLWDKKKKIKDRFCRVASEKKLETAEKSVKYIV